MLVIQELLIKRLFFCSVMMFMSMNVVAGNIYHQFPAEINPNDKYVFYSHGFIVEGTNERPKHKVWGVYDFPAVKAALKDDSYHLLAYHRPAKTNPNIYAKQLAQEVNTLIEQGVAPENITILGFSRGGAISIATSNALASDKVKTIILAGCAGAIAKNPEIHLYGQVYSIYETSDQVGSCQFVIDRSKNVVSFEELAISTGKSHGAFYRPIAEWVEPVKKWIKSQ